MEKKENPVTKVVKGSGDTADATIKEAGKLAGDTMTTAGKAVESGERAVTGVGKETIRDVGELGGEVGGLAKDAAENIAATPRDLGKAAWTGKTEKHEKK